ncbi:VOC family protein [Spirillospora sp. NPDC047279]|uniref:VOC family protein n=1 Tax=Spirillospora sp. NPDC047279 TaxID=3155478 RepID=UPI0033FFE7B0
MEHPVVHFEIIGSDPGRLRGYYGALFGWEYQLGDAVTEEVSAPGEYGFVPGAGVPGGIGGGPGHAGRVLFYVGVPDVEEALRRAESLGGKRTMGPSKGGDFSVGHFTDPEGNLIGIAGPPAEEAR